jgi:hypothetical protein
MNIKFFSQVGAGDRTLRLMLFFCPSLFINSCSFYMTKDQCSTGQCPFSKFFLYIKGMGTLLKILHLSYSFGQKCSKLGTFTVKGLKIKKRE